MVRCQCECQTNSDDVFPLLGTKLNGGLSIETVATAHTQYIPASCNIYSRSTVSPALARYSGTNTRRIVSIVRCPYFRGELHAGTVLEGKWLSLLESQQRVRLPYVF